MSTATFPVTASECWWTYRVRPRKMPQRAFDRLGKDFGKTLWDRAVIGLAEIDLEGHWIAANPALCDLLEYTESELQTRTFQQITHPDDVGDDVTMMSRLRDGRLDHYVMSKRYITKRGRVIWIKLRVDPVVDESGQIVLFLSQIVPAKEIGLNEKVDPKSGEVKFSFSTFIQREWKWLIAATVTIVGFIVQQRTLQVEMTTQINNNSQAVHRIETQLKDIAEALEKK